MNSNCDVRREMFRLQERPPKLGWQISSEKLFPVGSSKPKAKICALNFNELAVWRRHMREQVLRARRAHPNDSAGGCGRIRNNSLPIVRIDDVRKQRALCVKGKGGAVGLEIAKHLCVF